MFRIVLHCSILFAAMTMSLNVSANPKVHDAVVSICVENLSQVSCFGRTESLGSSWINYALIPPSNLGTVRKLVTSLQNQLICALTDTGMKCWGEPEDKELAIPTDLDVRRVDDVTISTGAACALQGKQYHCWGRWIKPQNSRGQFSERPKYFVGGHDELCAIHDTQAECVSTRLGTGPRIVKLEGGTANDIVKIKANHYDICWVYNNNKFQCVSGPLRYSFPNTDIYTDVTMADNWLCLKTTSNKILCHNYGHDLYRERWNHFKQWIDSTSWEGQNLIGFTYEETCRYSGNNFECRGIRVPPLFQPLPKFEDLDHAVWSMISTGVYGPKADVLQKMEKISESSTDEAKMLVFFSLDNLLRETHSTFIQLKIIPNLAELAKRLEVETGIHELKQIPVNPANIQISKDLLKGLIQPSLVHFNQLARREAEVFIKTIDSIQKPSDIIRLYQSQTSLVKEINENSNLKYIGSTASLLVGWLDGH